MSFTAFKRLCVAALLVAAGCVSRLALPARALICPEERLTENGSSSTWRPMGPVESRRRVSGCGATVECKSDGAFGEKCEPLTSADYLRILERFDAGVATPLTGPVSGRD